MSTTTKNDFDKFKEKEPECFRLDTLTDAKYLSNRLWHAYYTGCNSRDKEVADLKEEMKIKVDYYENKQEKIQRAISEYYRQWELDKETISELKDSLA